MSEETLEWLNNNTLVGFGQRPWHFRGEFQDEETNLYSEGIPVEDVIRRLFNWKPVEGLIVAEYTEGEETKSIYAPDRKAIVRPDLGIILGVFKEGYQIHDYEEWLLNTVANLLDDDLGIASAGLLKGGAVAWVSVQVPNSITTPEGVEFRPNLMATTSLDGSLASQYLRHIINVVCDNTQSIALGEHGGQIIKFKHTKYSQVKLSEAKEALGIVHEIADEFTKEVAELCNISVSEGDWQKFLNEIAPIPEDEGRAMTMAENKQSDFQVLWNHDDRVTPWKGTAYGVVQAVNTYAHHKSIVRGKNRAEKNMLMAVNGDIDKLDQSTLKTLETVLA